MLNFSVVSIVLSAMALLCHANNNNIDMCRLYDGGTKTLRYFCDDGWTIENPFHQCSNASILASTRSLEVLNLRMKNCDRDTVASALEQYRTVTAFDFSYSEYKTSDKYLTFGKYSLDFLDIKHYGIQKINGSHNELANVPRKIFNAYTELVEIDFRSNKFISVNLSEFHAASKLKAIHLGHNYIRTIAAEDFAQFVHLEYVDLSFNRIQYFWAETFRYNTFLQMLHFDGNPIEYFNCRIFFKMSMASVHLPWTRLKTLILTFCPDMEFDVVVNGETGTGLFATSKAQYSIHCDKESFKNLTYFAIGPHQTRNILSLLQCFTQSIEDISLDGLTLCELNSTVFRQFLNLKRLSLRETKLRRFDFSLLINQRQLYELDISNNNLQALGNVVLSQFTPNLTHFVAAGNRFENATENILQKLTSSITTLDLSGSSLGVVNASTFCSLKNLRKLKLNRCNLTIIESTNPFEELQNLIDLDISNNNLQRTNFKRMCATFARLKKLRMSNCALENVDDVTQYLGKNLKFLDLSANFLGELNMTTFKLLTELEYLYLDGAFITRFDWNTLQSQRKLLDLRLTNNHLSEIDVGSMSSTVRWLNFDGNDLIEIKHLTKDHFPNLEYLRIANNRLGCENLQQLYREWGTKLSHFDPWQQKHRLTCNNQFLGIGKISIEREKSEGQSVQKNL